MNDKMEVSYRIALSSSEIITLASMLGAESIIGIQRSDTSGMLYNTSMHIDSALKGLEERKIVAFSFDGTLYVVKAVARIIRTMMSPDKVAVVSHTPRGGGKKSFCILKRGEHTVKCEKNEAGGYILNVLEALTPDIFPEDELFSSELQPFSLTLPLDTAEKAARCIEGFDTGAAEEIFADCGDDMLPMGALCEALSGNCPVMNVKMRVKRGTLYTTVYRDLLVFTTEGVLRLSDTEGNITITAAAPEETTKRIIGCFAVD